MAARSTTRQRLEHEHLVAVAEAIGEMHRVGNACIVHVDVHVPAQVALVIEDIGAQARIDRKDAVEDGADAAARHLLDGAGEIALQIRGEGDAGHGRAPYAAVFAGSRRNAYSVFTGVTLRRISRTGQCRPTLAFGRSMWSALP